MDFFAPLFSPVVECIGGSCATVARQIGYIKNLERNFEKLNEEARTLSDKKEDAENEAKRDGNKIPTKQSGSWLKKVNEIQNQVNSIEEEYSKRDKRCLSRWCLNVPSSWKLGRRVVLTTDAALNLCKFDGGVVVDALPPTAEIKPVLTIQDGTSTERTLQKILNSVRDPIKHKIGIWGMGGVGKTTVMKNLNNHPEMAELFDIVIWVTVSRDKSTRELQTEIAQRLPLNFPKEDSDERVASRLFQKLTNMKFLLLMDDLWKEVDLHDIGVPCPNQKGCKIVFTTRYHDVCRNMETNEEIKVETLSEKDAWDLFREKVGEVADSPIIRPLATSVVHECGGLPLVIIVIGAFLRNEENVHIWQNAMQELSSPEISDLHDMELRVFKRLQFSFDRLEDDNVRNCFLYVALYPEDHEINIFELIKYWRAEGLIHSGSTLENVRNKGHAMVKRLVDASLILKSDESNVHVKMHDVIRDLALRITSRMESGCRFLVRAKKMIEEPPKNEDWENVNRMSLMENEIGSLPKRPNCPTLLTLLLQINRKLTTIPESFFDQMHALQVLDLSFTGIKSLPHSICRLVNLRGLYLKHCFVLKNLPPEIGKLTRIVVLDARGTHINSLPTEIRQLSGLKVLHVTFSMKRDKNEEDEKVSGGIISRFFQLEQLIIDLGFNDQDFSRYGDTCAEAVMEEVSCLKGLTSLQFGFPKMEYLECFLQRSHPWKKEIITSFHFIVGQYQNPNELLMQFEYFPEGERRNRMLTFCGYDSIPNAIVEVLRQADSFMLLGHTSVHSLCEFGMQNMSGLVQCQMQKCDAKGIVVDGNQLVEAALPKLGYLEISHMPNLRSIWAGSFPPGSLNCLKSLILLNCEKLKNIFSHEIILQLFNLEYLIIHSCPALEEVISDEEIGVESDCVLPKLKLLFLSNLPSLVRILKLGHLLNCSSLEVILASECPNLKRLPISVSKAPKLKTIHGQIEWWDDLAWDDNDVRLQLDPLFSHWWPLSPEVSIGVIREVHYQGLRSGNT